MIVLIMGVSGCGKTTIAAALAAAKGWTLREGDQFHPPANVAKMAAGKPLTDEDRWPWLDAIAAKIAEHRIRGESAVVACSALRRVYRDRLIGGQPDTALVYLRGDRATIARRLAARADHFMPPALLDSQFRALEEPSPDENPIVIDIGGSPDNLVRAITERLT